MHFGVQMDMRSALFFEIDAYNKMVVDRGPARGRARLQREAQAEVQGQSKETCTWPRFIEVREVGLRDGIQNIKTVVPTDLKLAWIKAEVAAGVRDIEVCSFVPPKLLPQFADAEEVTRRALQIPGLTVAALMPNLKGAERGAALGVHRLDYVVSVSEGHNLNNVRRSTAESLADLQRIADFLEAIEAGKRPRLLCGLATSFGCTIEGNVPHDRVVKLRRAGRGDRRRRDRARRHGRLRQSERDPHAVHARVARRSARTSRSPRISTTRAGSASRTSRPRSRSACAASTPRSAGSAAVPSRRARPATSSPRTWCSSPSRSASTPASISTG